MPRQRMMLLIAAVLIRFMCVADCPAAWILRSGAFPQRSLLYCHQPLPATLRPSEVAGSWWIAGRRKENTAGRHRLDADRMFPAVAWGSTEQTTPVSFNMSPGESYGFC